MHQTITDNRASPYGYKQVYHKITLKSPVIRCPKPAVEPVLVEPGASVGYSGKSPGIHCATSCLSLATVRARSPPLVVLLFPLSTFNSFTPLSLLADIQRSATNIKEVSSSQKNNVGGSGSSSWLGCGTDD